MKNYTKVLLVSCSIFALNAHTPESAVLEETEDVDVQVTRTPAWSDIHVGDSSEDLEGDDFDEAVDEIDLSGETIEPMPRWKLFLASIAGKMVMGYLTVQEKIALLVSYLKK